MERPRPFDATAAPTMRYLLDEGFVERDGQMLFIGPQAEKRFGHRHFMGVTAVFTAPPQFTVLEGRREIGRTDPALLRERVEGPRVLLLGGRSRRVTWIDWKRRHCFVEETERGGRAWWLMPGLAGTSFTLTRAERDVLLGEAPRVAVTERARARLAPLRDDGLSTVHPGGTVITIDSLDVRWFTWAGFRANATLAATLSGLVDEKQSFDDPSVRLRTDLTRDMWRSGIADVGERLCLPNVDERALA